MANVLIIGPGAVGGFFGWKLSAHHSISVVARGEHAAVIRKKGLTIRSEGKDFVFHPTVFENVSAAAEPDFCLVTVKNGALPDVLEELKNVGWQKTTFLSLLNGIEANRLLADAVGPEKTVNGFCQLGAEMLSPGLILHRALGKVFLGKNSVMPDVDFEQTKSLFLACTVETAVPADFERSLWLKFAWNAVFNTLCALLNTTTDVILTTPEFRIQADRLFDEILAAAHLENIDLREEDRVGIIDGTLKWGAFIPSTLQDRRKRKPLETDAFTGAILRLGKRHGVRFPGFEELEQKCTALTDS